MADPTTQAEATHQPEVSAPVPETATDAAPAVEPTQDQPIEADKAEESAATEKNGDTAMEEDDGKEDKEDKADKEDKEDNAHKTGAHAHHHDNKSKFDPSVLSVTDDPHIIRVQVEFYFGDNNLPQDKYMWNLTSGFENKPVPLKTICSFGRMRRFQPYEAVVKALRDSQFLVVSGEDGNETVVRKVPYKSSKPGDKFPVSVYVKGFGDEQPSTQFDIEAFFAKFGPVNAIRLRRDDDHLFKGSVFAEFETEAHAKAFLALDPPPKYEGRDLKIMSKRDYVDEKTKLIKQGKLEPSKSKGPRTFWEGQDITRDRKADRFKGDKDDWRARKDHDHRNNTRGGRGGRGRGRGGRGRGGRDFDRNNRRDGDRRDNADGEKSSESNGKRSRDEDGATAQEPPAKKVDIKAEA
ncbi:La domain-containing protein [Diaporthe helianthi]|uniref:La domain-containing protein n=1 Tax=Diaporthe helianthi TaxID=158607 RepID=A0A2P5IDF2_DIAHE|nr:La domain-containing protein [Diaporthe helianthi]